MNYENYKNKLSYPNSKLFTKYKIVTIDKTIDNLDSDQFDTIIRNLHKNNVKTLTERTVDEDAYKLAIDEYHKEERRIEELFISDLKEYYGDFSNYPNADKLFSIVYHKAYEDGHSSGRQSVAEKYDELYDFVRQILKLTEKNG